MSEKVILVVLLFVIDKVWLGAVCAHTTGDRLIAENKKQRQIQVLAVMASGGFGGRTSFPKQITGNGAEQAI
jgi:ribulose kinase